MPKYSVERIFSESNTHYFVVDAKNEKAAEKWVDRWEYDRYENDKQKEEAERRVAYIGKRYFDEDFIDVETTRISEKEYADGLKEKRKPGDTIFFDPPIGLGDEGLRNARSPLGGEKGLGCNIVEILPLKKIAVQLDSL